jgi:hypothetical protein
MAEWWAIEVLNGDAPASRWHGEHASALLEAALTNGARDASWRQHRWGVSFEALFDSEEQWEAFRNLPVVRAALDAVPDPVNGLLIYRGRGGGAGSRMPRKPKRPPAAGAMELAEGPGERHLDLTGATPGGSAAAER